MSEADRAIPGAIRENGGRGLLGPSAGALCSAVALMFAASIAHAQGGTELAEAIRDGDKTMAVGAYTEGDAKLGVIQFDQGATEFGFGLKIGAWLRLRTLLDKAIDGNPPAWTPVGEVTEDGPAPSRLTLVGGPGGHVRLVLHTAKNESLSFDLQPRDSLLFEDEATEVKSYLLLKECHALRTCDPLSRK